MPSLRALEAEFIRYEGDGIMRTDVQMQDADGVMFLCPKCFAANGGSVGTHRVICNRPRVPQSPKRVGPGRWEFVGTSMDDLSLVAGSSSVKLLGGCEWHGFVKNGNAE